tara:strand:+ start:275 stop:787 length:513 start_codon:yes stop_codon:yes gene_type:complete
MPSRTPQQKQKYNHAKRIKTYNTSLANVKELLSNDSILKDIDVSTLTDEKIASTIALLRKVAIINKQKVKLNENEPVVEPVIISPPKKKRTPIISSPKQDNENGKLTIPSVITKSKNSDLKKKYIILMKSYNQSLEDMENIPADARDRIANIKKSMSKALDRLKKMETRA